MCQLHVSTVTKHGTGSASRDFDSGSTTFKAVHVDVSATPYGSLHVDQNVDVAGVIFSIRYRHQTQHNFLMKLERDNLQVATDHITLRV